jgi:hypothetical protein
MGRALADEGHATVLASFIEARHSLVVGEAPPALGAETRSAGTHAAATLPTSTVESSSSVSSLPFHLILLVRRLPPKISVTVTVSAVVEAAVVAELAAE